ncbi:MAG TPA: DMT family transporter [Steroidobacteraceae bacterium]|nr:DMT family transporter [Steroidobacteraceae bacterium]
MRVSPIAVLCIAVLAVAHGSIFVRLATDAQPLAIAAWRLTLATAIVLPIIWLRGLQSWRALDARTLGLVLGASALLAGHFATWISSLAFTSISNSVVLVSTAPLWVAVIGRLTGALRLSRLMTWAVMLSVIGAVIIGWGSARIGFNTLRGDLLALAGAACMGGYLLIAQRIQRTLAFAPYVGLVYGATALLLWLTALTAGTPMRGFGTGTWWALGGIALVSQVIGHSGYNWSLRHLRPDFVAVTLLAEPIVASILGLILFREAIPTPTLAGGIVILAAIALAARAQLEEQRSGAANAATAGSPAVT